MKRVQIFEEFINESYKNFIGFDETTRAKKERWVDEVWDMLQTSYESMGGIKGSGFESKQDMIDKIPFWKLKTKKGELQYVIMYKDKGARKRVAIGTSGSKSSIQALAKDQERDLKRAFGERSGPALTFAMKSIPFEVIKEFIKTPDEVKRLTGKDIIPLREFDIRKLDSEDIETYERFKHLLMDYFYVRKLGGEWHLKVMMGNVKEMY